MSPLSRLNAAADAITAAAGRLEHIGDSDVPAELVNSFHNATETVSSSARAVRSMAFEWERAADTIRTVAAVAGAVILLRFAWDVFKDVREL